MKARMLAVVVIVVMAVGAVSAPVLAYDFPSTNDENRTNGHPHVDEISVGVGEVTLEFLNSTNSLAYFEYRIDGEVLTSGTAHPVVGGDYIYPGVCVDNRATPNVNCVAGSSTTQTFSANEKVEVRLALGGERDWDFDWVTFYVDQLQVVPTTLCMTLWTGHLSAQAGNACAPGRYAVTIPGPVGSTLCVNPMTNQIILPWSGACAGGWLTFVIPDDGPVNYCENTYTHQLRFSWTPNGCRINERPGVIGETFVV